jgi:hypothetical protein
VIRTVAVLLLATLAWHGDPRTVHTRAAASEYYAARPGSLAAARRRLAAGDPAIRAAVDALVAEADRLLAEEPPTVTAKQHLPPSGNRHDYASLAPYYWPDATATDGLPYVRRDGRGNPEADDPRFTDRRRARLLGSAVRTLGLAWNLTGRPQHAAQAATFIRTWFVDEATRMTPHLRHAQAVRGGNDGRGAGILEGRDLVDAIDAVALIDDADVLSAEDRDAVSTWAEAYLDWILTSEPGVRERAAANNHGTYYDVQVVQLALATGRPQLARSVLEEAGLRRIAAQIEPDGSQPHELIRTRSLGYSAFNLRAFCRLATLGDHAGVDLWHYETSDGRSIRGAIDYVAPYAAEPSRWPHEQIGRVDPADFATILWQAGIVYDDPAYRSLVAGPTGDTDGWIRLTFTDD